MRVLTKLVGGIAAVAALAAGGVAHAEYPDKPVKVIVGFAPGGFTDVLARIIAQGLQDKFGQPFVVENKPGASGTIGADTVAKSKPDGNTLLLAHVMSNAIAPSLFPQLPYNATKDFSPIIRVASTPMVLTVNAALPAKDVKELIELSKTKGLNYASSGEGSVQHLAAELFSLSTGVKMTHIPYKGSGQAIIDLLSGQVDLNFESPPNILPHIKAGKLRALAVTSKERLPSMPDVPTMQEAGIKNAEVAQWFGIVGPANLPQDIVVKLNAEIANILKSPQVIERIRSQEGTIIGGGASDFSTFLTDDIARWGKLVKDANVKIN